MEIESIKPANDSKGKLGETGMILPKEILGNSHLKEKIKRGK